MVFLDQASEGSAIFPSLLGASSDVALMPAQHPLQVRTFELFQGLSARVIEAHLAVVGLRCLNGYTQMGREDFASRGKDCSALKHIHQFADVTRPIVLLEQA